jgi:hypothetical protein
VVLSYRRSTGAGIGYLNDFGQPTAYFPVGYPLTLAAIFRVFGTELLVAQYVNVLMSVATMALTYALARSCNLPARTSLLAAAAWGFLPNQLISPIVTMAEIPFTLALTLGLVLLVREPFRWSSYVLAGVVFGWATLIRPRRCLCPLSCCWCLRLCENTLEIGRRQSRVLSSLAAASLPRSHHGRIATTRPPGHSYWSRPMAVKTSLSETTLCPSSAIKTRTIYALSQTFAGKERFAFGEQLRLRPLLSRVT